MTKPVIFNLLMALHPTYAGQVYDIFERNCSMCHNKKILPALDLQDYDVAFAQKDKILERIHEIPLRNMLTNEEKLIIRNWVVGGGKK